MDPQIAPSNGLFASSSATWWTYIRRVSRDVFIGAAHATARRRGSSGMPKDRFPWRCPPSCRVSRHGLVSRKVDTAFYFHTRDHTSIPGRPALAGGGVIVDACLLRQVGTIPPA